MKIGFIVGKDDEIYDDDYLYELTPKKIFAERFPEYRCSGCYVYQRILPRCFS